MIAELNGAVDVRPWYRCGGDVYADAVFELLRTAADRRVLAVRLASVDGLRLQPGRDLARPLDS